MKFTIAFLLLLQCQNILAGSKASKELTEILKQYDKRVRPSYGNGTTDLKVQISVVAVGPINEKDFTFRIDYFMRQWWKDERLVFSEKGDVTFNGNPKNLIWLPDLFVRNSKEVKMHTSITDSIRTTIKDDGSVYMSARISAICSCNMNLKAYPMDSQVCSLTMESYAYQGNELNIKWHENPVEYKPESIQVEGYKLTGIHSSSDVVTYITKEFFPLLKIHLHVQRTVSYYIFRSYVPSSFLVVMTWGTFWLPATTYPARVGIIVTNFLASSFILQGASAMYTKVPYTTAIEVFLLVNITFILAVMLEYIAVIQTPNFNIKKLITRREENDNDVSMKILTGEVDGNEASSNGSVGATMVDKKTEIKQSHPLDRFSCIVFPLSYSIFLIAYFASYYG